MGGGITLENISEGRRGVMEGEGRGAPEKIITNWYSKSDITTDIPSHVQCLGPTHRSPIP